MRDEHNLVAHTVRATPRRRLPCAVGCAIDPYQNGGRTWTWCHRWQAGEWKRAPTGEHRTPLARCVNCGKTPRELLDPPVRPRAPRPGPDHASDGWLRAAIESGR